jgi:hypothetical protein
VIWWHIINQTNAFKTDAMKSLFHMTFCDLLQCPYSDPNTVVEFIAVSSSYGMNHHGTAKKNIYASVGIALLAFAETIFHCK